MVDAIGVTAASMVSDVTRMNTISHNLANSSTAGFKKALSVSQPFAAHLGVAQGSIAATPVQVGTAGVDSVVDFRPGALKFSGNPLDVALEDEGFFEVMTENGPAYTRQGAFRLDGLGRLISQDGLPVMGTSGEIVLSSAEPKIDASGRIFEGGREVAQLRVVKFEDPRTLQHAGSGLYLEGPASNVRHEGYERVRQGYTEASNVNTMAEMVRMIETMRHFEASQRVIQGYDEMLDKTIRTLGEF